VADNQKHHVSRGHDAGHFAGFEFLFDEFRSDLSEAPGSVLSEAHLVLIRSIATMAVATTAYVMLLVISHMTVSSTMLILNKAVLAAMPVATIVLLAQVGSSAVILWLLGKAKVLTVDSFQLEPVLDTRLCVQFLSF
jgi:hypothetical protein